MTVESQLREQLAKQEQELAGRDKRIAELEAQLAKLPGLKTELDRIVSRIPELEAVDAAKDARIAELEQAFLDQGECLAQLNRDCVALRERAEKAEAALRTISLMDKRYEHDLFSATEVARQALVVTPFNHAALSQTKEGEEND